MSQAPFFCFTTWNHPSDSSTRVLALLVWQPDTIRFPMINTLLAHTAVGCSCPVGDHLRGRAISGGHRA
jgi:hypothetical protein